MSQSVQSMNIIRSIKSYFIRSFNFLRKKKFPNKIIMIISFNIKFNTIDYKN